MKHVEFNSIDICMPSSVGIATDYGLGGRNSVPGRAKKFFLHSIHAGFEAHPASYPVGTWDSFPGHIADHSPAEVRNGRAISPLLLTYGWHGA
jgi:hypothetical protein